MEKLKQLGGKHGIGRIEHMEDRVVGLVTVVVLTGVHPLKNKKKNIW